MLQQEIPDDYVIATGKTYTVREFLNLVFAHANLDVSQTVEIDERLFRPHEVPILLGDSKKAREKLGWEPETSLKELAMLMYENDLKCLGYYDV